MKIYKQKDFKKGWLIGDFIPSIIQTKDFEVCYRTEKAGPIEKHYHEKGPEITVLIRGKELINGKILATGPVR